MGRRQFNDGMEVVFEDFNKMGSTVEKELYDRVIFELVQRGQNSFFSDGFLTSYSSPTQVSVASGVGFQTDNTQVDPEPTKRLLFRSSASNLNLSAPDSVNNRIDIVCVKSARVAGSTESRKYKAPITFTISNQNLVVSNDWEAEFIVTPGVPSGSPAIPATPAGYIKIAELLVSAVTGLSGAGAVTDTRVLMPVGGTALINSLSAVRITANAALAIQSAILELDVLAKHGELDYNDFADLVTDPAAPAAGILRAYNKGGVMFVRDNTTITPFGSGGGGGGGADWKGDALEDIEYSQKVKEFAQGDTQKETLYAKVPQGYVAGRQIKMYLNHYSPSSSNQFKMQAVTTLIRKNLDAITSVANQNTSNSGDITNTVANQSRELLLTLTDTLGKINSFSVSYGDLLKIELTRIVPSGAEDTADIRMVPTTTEVKFG